MTARTWGLLGLGLMCVAGCTKSNPAYCESHADCTADPAAPFCDVDGSVEGTANACIPTPADTPDAAPSGNDAASIDAACVPTTCATEGKNCGEMDDRCGATINCGVCVLPLTCGGGASPMPNVCGGTCTPGSWTVSTIVEAGASSNVFTDPALVIDNSGVLRAAFRHRDGATRVRYAERPLGTWFVETVDEHDLLEIGVGTSLAVDSLGTVHITHGFNYDTLRYATRPDGGDWTVEPIDSVFISESSLLVDAEDGLHVVFDAGGIWYAHKPSTGSWLGSAQVVPSPAQLPSLARAPDGTLHVTYYDGTAEELRHANETSDGWDTVLVDDVADISGPSSLAVDTDGDLHVTYVAGRVSDTPTGPKAKAGSPKRCPRCSSLEASPLLQLATTTARTSRCKTDHKTSSPTQPARSVVPGRPKTWRRLVLSTSTAQCPSTALVGSTCCMGAATGRCGTATGVHDRWFPSIVPPCAARFPPQP